MTNYQCDEKFQATEIKLVLLRSQLDTPAFCPNTGPMDTENLNDLDNLVSHDRIVEEFDAC